MSEQPEFKLPAEPYSMTMLASRIFDTPLLIHERKLQQILNVLGDRLDVQVASPPPEMRYTSIEQAHAAIEQAAMQAGTRAVWNEGGYFNVGAAAVIPVIGTLVQRSSWMDSLSGLISYGRIERAFSSALADPLAEEIIFELDTPGGEVAGAFDLAERIYQARGEKPLTAIASEFAASAGYLLASAAETVVLPATGLVGSIGVVAAHIDRSREMEKRGIAVTFVYAGEKKIDGNPYQPLSERARAEWQEDIDELYGMFAAAVARGRAISETAVRDTQAGLFMGRKAVDGRLADRVNTFSNEVYNASIRRGGASNRLTTSKKESTMEQKEIDAKIAEARAEGVAEGRKATAAKPAAPKAPDADALKKAVAADRERVTAILNSDEAKGREDFAEHLALSTDLDQAQAIAMLAKAPKGEGKTALAAAMEQLGSPGIPQQEATDSPATPKVEIDANKIYAKANEAYSKSLAR